VTTLLDDLDLGGRLSLDDQMSAALERIGPAWERATTAVVANGQRLSQQVNDLSTRVSAFGSRVVTSVSSAFGGLGRTIAAFTGMSGILGSILSGPAGIAAGLHGIVRGAMEAGGEIEQLQLAFATLMGSSDLARQHLAELQQFAVGKPFEFAFLATASRQLQTFGYSAREAMGMLADFGDAASGAGTGTRGFETYTRIAGQIRTMGRMTRGQVSQLGRAGLDVSRLRENLGMTEAQFANIAKAGIPAERLMSALRQTMQQQWGGGMARASATLAAKLSDLDDVIGNMRRQMYEALGPALIPVIDRFSSFLTLNAKRIASAFSLVVTTSIHLVEVLIGPMYGAFSDVLGRAQSESASATGGMIRMMQRASLVIEGAAALIIGDNGRGITGISAALRDRLVAAGLWPAALAIARFANRARAFLGGFAEAMVSRFGQAATRVRWLADALGITSGGMGTSADRARELGASVARLIGTFLVFRTSLRFVGVAVTAITTLANVAQTATRAFQAIRAVMWVFGLSGGTVLLIAGAVVALGAAIYYLSQNAEAVAFFRRAWEGLRETFAPVGALFERAWESMKALGEELATTVSARFRELGEALRPLLGPLRILGSLIAVTLCVPLVAIGGALYLMGRGLVFYLSLFLRGFTGIVPIVVWAATMFGIGMRWIGAQVAALAVLARPYVAAVGRVLRAVGAVALWLGLTAFRGLYDAASMALTSLWGVVAPILSQIRSAIETAFGFILPFVAPIFESLAEIVRSAFSSLVDFILAPMRAVAGSLVAIFRALPARLQPAELRGAVQTLDTFSRNDPDPVRQGTNASRAAPARAANAATAAVATVVSQGAAPAPVINLQPAPVTLVVDGRVLARSTERHNETEAIRSGRPVSTAPNR